MKTLDFGGGWGPDLGVFSACRAKTRYDVRLGRRRSRGTCFPGKLWWQPRKSKWAFFGKVDWQMLVDEQNKHPGDAMLKKWVNQMGVKCGSDVLKLPNIGCKSIFVPRKKWILLGGRGPA